MSACRLINSPVTGKQETSLTWEELLKLTGSEKIADRIYKELTSASFIAAFGDWTRVPLTEGVNALGEPTLESIKKYGLLPEAYGGKRVSITTTRPDVEGVKKQSVLIKSLDEKLSRYQIQKVEGKLEYEDQDDQNYYQKTVGGKTEKVKRRVTDFVRERKSPQVLAKFETASKEKKREWKEKALYGTRFHKDAENIIRAAVDEDGYLKRPEQLDFSALKSTLPKGSLGPLLEYLVGKKLDNEDFIPGVLYTMFPQGTRFRVEQMVYDERRDVAGTIDLMGITPEGKLMIWDWKTKFLNKTLYDDVPHFSQSDYRIQLDQYQNVLKTYGLSKEQMPVAQAMPIIMEGSVDPDGAVTLQGLELPVLDIKTEKRRYLLPVPLKDQSTGNKTLDDFIRRLYQLHEQLYKVPTQDKERKNQQLNSIAAAIRELQIKQNFEPVTFEAQTFMLAADRAVKDVDTLLFPEGEYVSGGFEHLKGGEEAFRSTLKSLLTVLKNIDQYRTLYGMFQDIYGADTLTPEQKLLADQLKSISGEAEYKKDQALNAFRKLMDWYGKGYGVNHILDVEKVVRGAIDREVQSTSRIQTYATELFYKLQSEAKSKRDIRVQERLEEFEKLLHPFWEHAKALGLSPKDAFSLLSGDKNTNKLLRKVKKEAYEALNKATLPGKVDTKWIRENIDMEAFEKQLSERHAQRLKEVDESVYATDPEEDNQLKQQRKREVEESYSLEKSTSGGWLREREMQPFLKEDLWLTDEYKKLKSQPAAFALYQWIENFNYEAIRSGYHSHQASKRFLPWVRGDFFDKLGDQGMKAVSDALHNLYTVHADEQHLYSKEDRLELPKPFTQPMGKQQDGSYDLSGISTDIGRNMALYIQAVLDFKAMDEIEDYADAIITLEKAKGHLEVDKQGNIVRDEVGKPRVFEGNEENTRLLKSQVEALLYKRFYDNTSGLPPEATKLIESTNKWLRMKVFAFNPLTPFINTMGGNFQGMINSGKYWTGKQWVVNEARLLGSLFQGKEGNLIKGLVDYFLPLTENENVRTGKQMSLQFLNRFTMQDVLLGHLSKADRVIQVTAGLSMLENTMLKEGKLVNIRDWWRNSPEYVARYKLAPAERKALERGFEEKVRELKEKYGLIKQASFNKDGVLEIEGLSRESDTFHQYRRLMLSEIKNLTGMLSDDEKRNMERNVIFKSMLMFKTWIPRMAEVRFGALKHNHSTDEYDMGRTRIWWNILINGTESGKREGNIFKGLLQGLKDLRDMRTANERGVHLLDQYYHTVRESYYNRTGKQLEMTPERFYDLTRDAIRMQIKDNISLLTLVMLYYGTAAAYHHLDDPEANNIFKTVCRTLDKLHDELSFYYNPTSLQQVANGSMIPSIGVISDAVNVVKSIGKDVFGNEQTQQSAHPLKAILRSFPLMNQGAGFFLPLIDPEAAKELGVQVSSTNNVVR